MKPKIVKWKVLLVVLAVLLPLLGPGLLLHRWFTGPFYRPGVVRSETGLRDPLAPPSGGLAPPGFWQVAPDIRLNYFSEGWGSSVLVLHGGPGVPTARPWRGLSLLRHRHRFIYYHQRGCGRSTRPLDRFEGQNRYQNMKQLVRTLGLQAQIADIERIRRILGPQRLTLIGHSFGAFLAALYAVEFPRQVRGLVLVAPADLVVFPPFGEKANLLEAVKGLLAGEERKKYDSFLKRYLDFDHLFDRDEEELSHLNAKFIPHYRRAIEKKLGKDARAAVDVPGADGIGGWVQQAIYLSMGMHHDWTEAFEGLEVPVLVLHGEQDLQPKEVSQAYTRYFKGASFQTIPAAGHFLYDENPEAFGDAVEGFLKRLDSPEKVPLRR